MMKPNKSLGQINPCHDRLRNFTIGKRAQI